MEKKHLDIKTTLQQILSSDQAYQYRVVPIERSENRLLFKTDAKNLTTLKQELTIVLGKEVVLERESTENIDQYLEVNYRRRGPNRKNNYLEYSEDFLLNIIHEAKEVGSSDIHFEIFEKYARIRLRIDGKLLERFIISLEEYPKITNRIKIMASLDISEKRLPQDGRMNVTSGNEDFDIRVSTLPTLHGEKLVLRILTKNKLLSSLDTLGFSDKELTLYKAGVQKPNGIVLISGPTGSGKTTTLYATLKLLNTPDTNISHHRRPY